MNFGLDTIIKAFDKAFNLKKNVVALLHLVTALIVLFLLSFIGAKIGGGAAFAFSLIGLILFYYIFVRTNYFLTFFALEDLKSGKTPDYSAARTAFNEQKWNAVFVPVVFILGVVAVALIEALLMWIFAQIPVAGPIIQALIMIPLFLINFFLFMVIFFGSGLIFAIMIEQKKGIIATIQAILLTIKKRFQSILIYNLLAGFLVLMLIFITMTLTIFSLISSGGALLQGMFTSLFSRYSAFMPQMDVVTMIILFINLAVIIAFLLAYLYNVNAGINSSIYLAVKEGIDYNEKLQFNLDKVKAGVKDSLK